jgi:hypothetical protein
MSRTMFIFGFLKTQRSALLALLLSTVSLDIWAIDGSVASVIVDYPHGGCRLELAKDGSVSIAYGSMPRWIRVGPNTFDLSSVKRALRAREHILEPDAVRSVSWGSFQLPESAGLVRHIKDKVFVRTLLKRAWKARLKAKNRRETEDYRWVERACAFR